MYPRVLTFFFRKKFYSTSFVKFGANHIITGNSMRGHTCIVWRLPCACPRRTPLRKCTSTEKRRMCHSHRCSSWQCAMGRTIRGSSPLFPAHLQYPRKPVKRGVRNSTEPTDLGVSQTLPNGPRAILGPQEQERKYAWLWGILGRPVLRQYIRSAGEAAEALPSRHHPTSPHTYCSSHVS